MSIIRQEIEAEVDRALAQNEAHGLVIREIKQDLPLPAKFHKVTKPFDRTAYCIDIQYVRWAKRRDFVFLFEVSTDSQTKRILNHSRLATEWFKEYQHHFDNCQNLEDPMHGHRLLWIYPVVENDGKI